MCGGELNIKEDQTICECEYCGSKLTIPRLNNSKKAQLVERADKYRQAGDFDDARRVYEQILADDNTDSEISWGIVLCKYGINYVEDPKTKKRIPTVNRAQFKSILLDSDYLDTISKADDSQKKVYEEEAKYIDEVQEEILQISKKADKYDIFICYKETDNDGKRTKDSVCAEELYERLVKEGYKVFYAKRTLNKIIGQKFEPYIFAALNSSKVMLVVGSKKEHFEAVWVKNEWSRFISLVQESKGDKTIIPVYTDMDPYELPEELKNRQAQNLNEIGSYNNIVYGINEIFPNKNREVTIQQRNTGVSFESQLKRAEISLSNGEWDEVNKYCENILNVDPEFAEAYLYKLMAELHVRNVDQLKECPKEFNNSHSYNNAYRFGDDRLKAFLSECISTIKERNILYEYNRYVEKMNSAVNENDYRTCANSFERISSFRNADELAKQCRKKANDISREKENKKYKMIAIVFIIVVIAIVFLGLYFVQILPNNNYTKGLEYQADKKYEEAIEAFEKSNGYKDADIQIKETYYLEANDFLVKEKYDMAINIYNTIYDYKDSKEKICEAYYIQANELKEDENYRNALELYRKAGQYKDSEALISECEGMELLKTNVGSEVPFGEYNWKILAKEDGKALLIKVGCLEKTRFNDEKEDVTWETCSTRSWLNNEFYNTFLDVEKDRIVLSYIVTQDDMDYSTPFDGGSDTEDYIFLLSEDEAKLYFESDKGRVARCNGNVVFWCLRSKKINESMVATVSFDGTISATSVNDERDYIRPAMWVKYAEPDIQEMVD